MSIRILPQGTHLPSWFRRMFVLDYYDGPKEAIAECAEGHLALLRMVDWDALQDVRVFAVVEEEREEFDTLVALLAETENPRWPIYIPRAELSPTAQQYVKRVLDSTSREPDYVVASERPTKTVIASKLWPKGVDEKNHDWFGELGIERKQES